MLLDLKSRKLAAQSKGEPGGSHGTGGVFESISSAVKAVAGRFTAPLSGDEDTDRAALEKVTGATHDTAGAAHKEVRAQLQACNGCGTPMRCLERRIAGASEIIFRYLCFRVFVALKPKLRAGLHWWQAGETEEGAKGTLSEETRGKAKYAKEQAKQAGKEGASAAQHAAGNVKERAAAAAEEIKVRPRAQSVSRFIRFLSVHWVFPRLSASD